jgi:chromosome segregation ATPase
MTPIELADEVAMQVDNLVRDFAMQVDNLVRKLERTEAEVEALVKVRRNLVTALDDARKQRNELKDDRDRIHTAVGDELTSLRRDVKLLRFAIQSRDATIMDVTHDLAYAYEARANVIREKMKLAGVCATERHYQKLRLRALADQLRAAFTYENSDTYRLIRLAKSVHTELERAWRNA